MAAEHIIANAILIIVGMMVIWIVVIILTNIIGWFRSTQELPWNWRVMLGHSKYFQWYNERYKEELQKLRDKKKNDLY